jgi:hypothetical protein
VIPNPSTQKISPSNKPEPNQQARTKALKQVRQKTTGQDDGPETGPNPLTTILYGLNTGKAREEQRKRSERPLILTGHSSLSI